MSRDNLTQYFQSQPSLEDFSEQEISVEAMDHLDTSLSLSFEQVQVADDEVLTLEDAAAGLETIGSNVEASLEANTLDEQSLKFANLGLEAYGVQLGFERGSFIGLESAEGEEFDSKVSVGLEGIKETVQKIWRAIKTAVQKAIRAVQDFFAKIWGGVKKLQKINDELLKEVKGLEGEPKEKISVSGVSSLIYDGRVTEKSIVQGLEASKKYGDAIFGGYTEQATDFFLAMARHYTNDKLIKSDKPEDAATLEKDAEERMDKAMKTLNSLAGGKEKMIGGYGFDTIQQGPPKLVRGDQNKDAGETAEIETPNVAALTRMLEHTATLLELIDKKKEAVKKLGEGRKEALKSADKFAEQASSGKLGQAWAGARINVSLRIVNTNLGNLLTQYTAYTFSSVRAVHKLVQTSITAYK